VQGKPWTTNDGRGPYSIPDLSAFMRSSCRAVAADGKSGDCDLLLDYDHQADMKEAAGLAKPAAGWITKLEIREDGIYGRVDWTEKAKAAVAGREYRFISPVMIVDKRNNQIARLIRASLTNTPNFEMKAVASRDVIQEDSMDKALSELLAEIRKTLGLKDDADAKACVTAIAAAAGALKEVEKLQGLIKAIAAKLDLKPEATQSEFETAIAAQAQKPAAGATAQDELIKSLQKDIAELKAAGVTKTAEEKVTAAIAAGKVAPAAKDWALDYARRDAAGFDTFLKNQPVIIADVHARGTPPANANRDTSAEDAEVARQLGIPVEQMKKKGA
jgi:phage I-like protein